MKTKAIILGVLFSILAGCGSDNASTGSCGAKVCIKGKAEIQ